MPPVLYLSPHFKASFQFRKLSDVASKVYTRRTTGNNGGMAASHCAGDAGRVSYLINSPIFQLKLLPSITFSISTRAGLDIIFNRIIESDYNAHSAGGMPNLQKNLHKK